MSTIDIGARNAKYNKEQGCVAVVTPTGRTAHVNWRSITRVQRRRVRAELPGMRRRIARTESDAVFAKRGRVENKGMLGGMGRIKRRVMSANA